VASLSLLLVVVVLVLKEKQYERLSEDVYEIIEMLKHTIDINLLSSILIYYSCGVSTIGVILSGYGPKSPNLVSVFPFSSPTKIGRM